MVRVIFFLILISNLSLSKNIYEKNCVSCHNKIPISIDKYFYRYLLEYSSEKALKEAMFNFLTNPTKETSLMPEAFIKRFGLKRKTKLNDEELKEALNTYWNIYNLFGKLQ